MDRYPITLEYSVISIGSVCATLLSIIFLSRSPHILFAVLSVILLTLILYEKSTPPAFYLFVGLGGIFLEVLALKMGVVAWSYNPPGPFFLGKVPYWLLPMWGIAGGGVLGAYRAVEAYLNYVH